MSYVICFPDLKFIFLHAFSFNLIPNILEPNQVRFISAELMNRPPYKAKSRD
uniref:Uncharacterized protein n=1 Tax=Anguilla anguilla TaxID=7936 RepID=A0A0E9WIP8_ANGAN